MEVPLWVGGGADGGLHLITITKHHPRQIALLRGAHMVFIAAGMGGGTGIGAAPVVAEIAKELGALPVAVVSKPFSYEGKKCMDVADEGLELLASQGDSLIINMVRCLLDTGLPLHLIGGARSRRDWGVPQWVVGRAASNADIAGAGHLMMMEAPEQFAAVVRGNLG